MSDAVERDAARPRRGGRLLRAVVGVMVVVSVAIVATAMLYLPRWIAAEARAEARDRGLDLDLKSVSLSARGADLHDIRVHPLGDHDRGAFTADALEIHVAGTRVDRVRARGAKLDLHGSPDEVMKAFVPPEPPTTAPTTPGPTPPIVEADGSVRWTSFAGEGSALAFDVGDFEWDLATNSLRARFTKGQLDVGAIHVTPFDAVVTSSAADGFTAKLHHAPSPNEPIDLLFHRDAHRDRLELEVASLAIGRWLPSPAGFRLGDTTLDGHARFERPEDADKSSTLKLDFKAEGFKLPPLKVGPLFALPLPGTATLTLDAESKADAPSKLVVRRARVEGTVFKLTRGIDVRGTIDVGTRELPALVFALTWKSDAISCGDLASLTGVGAVAKAVRGVVYAEGKLAWDARIEAKPKVTANLRQTCDLDAIGAVDVAARAMADALGN